MNNFIKLLERPFIKRHLDVIFQVHQIHEMGSDGHSSSKHVKIFNVGIWDHDVVNPQGEVVGNWIFKTDLEHSFDFEKFEFELKTLHSEGNDLFIEWRDHQRRGIFKGIKDVHKAKAIVKRVMGQRHLRTY